MKKTLLLILLCCAGIFTANAQDSQGGTPLSFKFSGNLVEPDIVSVQPPDLTVLASEDNERVSKSEPLRIGVTLPVDFNLDNSGTWTELPDLNASLWRLTVRCKNAKAIGFGYSMFFLPEGASLFLYNKDKSRLLGAFTSENNTEDYFFSNEKIQGDEITLELLVPNDKKSAVILHITDLNYFYRLRENIIEKSSGACEVNVVCSPEGDNWQDERKGVCLIDIKNGSNWFNCTGSLVNNTSQNCTPYVLLADHCHYYSSYPSTSDYNSWVFYFRNWASTCSGTTGSTSYSKTGCTLKAHDTYGSTNNGSDFCLVQINSAITYDVYYNGWDRTNTASSSGVGIHHPSADIMKISTYTTPLTSNNAGGTGTHWQVTWAATTNGHGVTEQGSSGSPIFNSSGKIVGTLTGGLSYCATPTQPDSYGKIYYHWDQNGTTAATRLKDWLDPTNTGVTSLAGVTTCGGCTSPTTQATSFSSSAITNNTMTVGWTRGNGTGGVLVVARAGSAVNANPVSGTTYTANVAFGSGTQIGTGNYVVYKGTGTSVNVTALTAGTTYYYAVFEYNTTGICFKTPGLTGNATTTGTTPATCDTLSNILSGDSLTIYGFQSYWGTFTGHNELAIPEYAEYYSGITTPTYITGLVVYVGDAYSGATGGNHKVSFKVYAGGASTPGTVLTTQDVAISALNDYALNYITFSTPLLISTSTIYVGYQIYYNTPADTFNVVQTQSRTSMINSGFAKYNGTWSSYPDLTGDGLFSSLVVLPILCNVITDVSENEAANSVKVYPNPANNKLYVDIIMNDPATKTNAFIYDLQGRLIYNQALTNSTNPIDISDFTNGLYILKVESEEGLWTNKFIKE